MNIVYHKQVTLEDFDTRGVEVHLFCVEIKNLKSYSIEMIQRIIDLSWIYKLDAIPQAAYRSTAERTANELVAIFKKIENEITESFGEYLVSISAGDCLASGIKHTVIPLSELWKGRLTGNDGFDFHTKTHNEIINFGEAKYSSSVNKYRQAAEQILDFVTNEKDFHDANNLKNFVDVGIVEILVKERVRALAVAFSMHSSNYERILMNALKHEAVVALFEHCKELYIIGVRA